MLFPGRASKNRFSLLTVLEKYVVFSVQHILYVYDVHVILSTREHPESRNPREELCVISQSINQSIYLNQENPYNNKNSTEKHRNKACKKDR